MASIGNNTSYNSAYFRDCFLDSGENVYVNALIRFLNNSQDLGVIPFLGTLSTEKQIEIYRFSVEKLIKNRYSTNDQIALQMISLIKCKNINNVNYKNLYEYIKPEVKVVLSDTLNDLVELNQFTENEMNIVESSMGILLGSIEDLHSESIMER